MIRLHVTELLGELRADLDSATDDEARAALRFALLELREPRLHAEARAALVVGVGSAEALASAVDTCLAFMTGDVEGRLFSLWADFSATPARLAILEHAQSSRWASFRDDSLAPAVLRRLDEVVERARRSEALVR